MAAETISVYDNYVEVLEAGSVEALKHYAHDLSERIIPRGVETCGLVGIVLMLRDILARSVSFEKYLRDFAFLSRVLHAYDPAANRIANTVAVGFVEERVIRQQQDAIGELSTPVLPVRERLLVPPIIGVLDGDRADQLSEQMVRGIRTDHAKVVVINITGAPDVDAIVANHLVQTVDPSRLRGTSVIITERPHDRPNAGALSGSEHDPHLGDRSGRLEEAERLLGVLDDLKGRCHHHVSSGPAMVSILRQGLLLIASVHTALDDAEMLRFRNDLFDQIGRYRARGVVIDVAASGRDRLVRVQHTARHRRDGPAAGRALRHRRDPTRRGPGHGPARNGDRAGLHRCRPRGGCGVPRGSARITACGQGASGAAPPGRDRGDSLDALTRGHRLGLWRCLPGAGEAALTVRRYWGPPAVTASISPSRRRPAHHALYEVLASHTDGLAR